MRSITNKEVNEVSGGLIGSNDPKLLDASETHEAGQNSWGESTSGGAEFYAIALASAASDAAAYNRCLIDNSKPSFTNKVASGIEAVGVGATATILFGPAVGSIALGMTYDAMNSAAVKSNQGACDASDFF